MKYFIKHEIGGLLLKFHNLASAPIAVGQSASSNLEAKEDLYLSPREAADRTREITNYQDQTPIMV